MFPDERERSPMAVTEEPAPVTATESTAVTRLESGAK